MTDASIPTFTIASPFLAATISQRGAELVKLQDEAGRDLLWDGDPAFWSGRAPLLFPIVGRLKDDQLTVDGIAYPMKQHGIARLCSFTCVSHDASSCRLRLDSDETTRLAFPFDFRFEVAFAIAGGMLSIDVSVHNTGAVILPASMGFHPAFRWPLPYGGARSAHEVVFAADEPEPIRQVVGGLMVPRTRATPVEGRRLALDDALFVDDALIWLGIASRSLRYGPPGGRGLEVRFPSMPDLGLWSKAGAGFVCIEPWSGFASPQAFDGPFADKPGLIGIPPGTAHSFGMSVTLDAP